ncbi:MAG: NAD-dependent epimerase/dehydratase family protein [Candidatus Protochlamydia sp.]|nr:NAD-dependent epimerase/dehydratase family protein [Candidatus Protochlamydia sp.]
MKLIVMGAGYAGMAVLNYFQKLSHEIYVTTTRSECVMDLKPYSKEVLLLNEEYDGFQKLIDKCDGIIVMVAPKNPQNYEEVYLNTAKKITSSIKGRAAPFYILYTSSTSVCEGIKEEWADEDSQLDPTSENAKILLRSERLYLDSGAFTCVLRLGGIYGPGRDLPDRARRFSGKELAGTGEEPTNHIHLHDIVSAISFCLDHRLTGLYHLVNDDHPTRQELYSNFCQQMDIPRPVWNPHLVSLKGSGYKISNTKIKEAGFVFRHPFLI